MAYLGFSVSTLKGPTGTPLGKILMFQDLTEMKMMEDHVKRVNDLAAIGGQAAGIAHEIKNPLASMIGSVQLLKDEMKPTPVPKKLIQIVLREGDRLNTLINDFLLFARPSSGEVVPINLKEAINETIRLFGKSDVCRDRIRVVMNLSSSLWTEMDSQHLSQILWNLFLNAAESISDEGTIEVGVIPDGEGRVNIEIKENGCGMSKDILKNIFNPFFTTKLHGTGLGLSIILRILESYDGRLVVQSEEGVGSKFTVNLIRIVPADTHTE
nr:GHKL domain-containing protein [Desulfobacterales bacterium]